MGSYRLERFLLRLVVGLPAPRFLTSACRFYVATKNGENFGDMTINGEFRFLDEHGPACRTMFDVGASDGVWTEHALHVNPRAHVHCFEPLHASYARLVARGFPSHVICNPTGLSDVERPAEIFTASLSLHRRRGPGSAGDVDGESQLVELTTLDRYCAQRGIAEVDLLKIDTEGHDLAVLRGGRQMIGDGRIRRIQFEYGPRNIYSRVFLRDFYLFLEGLPYTMYQVTPRGLARVATYQPLLENLQYKNFVALHDSVRV